MGQAGIELQDCFGSVQYDLVGAVDLVISSVHDMQQALNVNIDMSSMVEARDTIHQTGIELQALIESNPMNLGTDMANTELEQLRTQLNLAVRQQNNLNHAMENMDVLAANGAYLRLSQTVGSTERYIRDNVDEQGRFSQQIQDGTSHVMGLIRAIGGVISNYVTLQNLSAAISLSDQLTSTTARLDMMNDGLQTTEALQNMISLSAERARSSYQTTADAVSKMGFMAGDAFSSNEEMVAFIEQINKHSALAGAGTSGTEAVMQQLTQVMGSGVLGGGEFDNILEQAPNIIQTIADYMEVPKSQLRDMATEGQITANVVKAAMFAAADETNEKFGRMPMTFEQIGTSLQNTALMALQPLSQNLNDIANSHAFQEVVDNAAGALSMLAELANPILEQLAGSQALWEFANGIIQAFSVMGAIVLWVVGLLVNGANMIAENWSWISPIVYGVAAALAVYYGWQLLCAIATSIMITASAIWGVITSGTVMAVILIIIALIAVFYAAVEAVNHFAGTSISATGIICGVFAVAGAFIGNLIVTVINFVIDIFCVLWNFIATFANFFANVFNDPVGSIARLFFDLGDCILGILESLASAIDTIFGSNLSGAVSKWRGSLGNWVDETFGKGEEVIEKVNGSDYHLDRFEYSGAWDAGYNFGQGIDNKVSGLLDGLTDIGSGLNPEDYMPDVGGAAAAGIGNNIATGMDNSGVAGDISDIAGNTGAMKDSVEITQEDLKYLRDIAEQETINRFTVAEVKIEQTNHNNVSSDMDLDGIVGKLTDAVGEAAKIATEGVHF